MTLGGKAVSRVAKLSLPVVMAGLLTSAFDIQAQGISGTIQFSGGALLDNANLALATQFLQIYGPTGPGSNPGVLASTETGNYLGIPNGTPAAFTPFTFNPAAGSVIPLWTLTIGATTYSFDATSVTVAYQDSYFLDIAGTGVAHITGMQDTAGTWSITDTGGNGSEPVFTFGAATQVGPIVPEPSTMAILALSALPFIYRFLVRRQARSQVGQATS